jgi:hypothetical protein
LIPFAKAIYKIEFEEKPNYNYLKFLLAKNLMEQNTTPNMRFEW